MKILKRILVVLLIIVIAVAISYLIFTAKKLQTEVTDEIAERIIY